MPHVINFNGTTYSSLDEMPADVRRRYEQWQAALTSGRIEDLPDLLQGLLATDGARALAQGLSNVVVQVNGQTYQNQDQLPPEARAKLEAYQAQYDANRNGIPDALEPMLAQMGATPALPGAPPALSAADAAAAPAFAASAPLMPVAAPSLYSGASNPSAISPEGGDNRLRLVLIAVAALALLTCGLAVVVAWAFLR